MRVIIIVRGQELYENDTRGTYHCLVRKLTMSSLCVTYVSLLTPLFLNLNIDHTMIRTLDHSWALLKIFMLIKIILSMFKNDNLLHTIDYIINISFM